MLECSCGFTCGTQVRKRPARGRGRERPGTDPPPSYPAQAGFLRHVQRQRAIDPGGRHEVVGIVGGGSDASRAAASYEEGALERAEGRREINHAYWLSPSKAKGPGGRAGGEDGEEGKEGPAPRTAGPSKTVICKEKTTQTKAARKAANRGAQASPYVSSKGVQVAIAPKPALPVSFSSPYAQRLKAGAGAGGAPRVNLAERIAAINDILLWTKPKKSLKFFALGSYTLFCIKTWLHGQLRIEPSTVVAYSALMYLGLSFSIYHLPVYVVRGRPAAWHKERVRKWRAGQEKTEARVVAGLRYLADCLIPAAAALLCWVIGFLSGKSPATTLQASLLLWAIISVGEAKYVSQSTLAFALFTACFTVPALFQTYGARLRGRAAAAGAQAAGAWRAASPGSRKAALAALGLAFLHLMNVSSNASRAFLAFTGVVSAQAYAGAGPGPGRRKGKGLA